MMKHIIYLNVKIQRTLNINLKITEDVKDLNYKENNVKIQEAKSE